MNSLFLLPTPSLFCRLHASSFPAPWAAILAIPLALLVSGGDLRAQTSATFSSLNVETSPTSPYHLELRSSGILIGYGTSTASLLSTDPAVGKEGILWHPGKQAFSVGSISADSYTSAGVTYPNRGNRSVSFFGKATGSSSAALISGTANGSLSVAIGDMANSVGDSSFAFGTYALSTGRGSMALGGGNQASGNWSTALGHQSNAGAYASVAVGFRNVGSFTNNNDGNPNNDGDTTWIATDPLFEVGNGYNTQNRSNALTVYKNGNATFQGVVRVAAGGDIPMFTPTP